MVYRLIGVLLVGALCAGCSATRYVDTPTDTVTLATTSEVNPNPSGRASPIVVKVYQLNERTTFDTLDFAGAFRNAKSLLGNRLKSSKRVVMRPGESAQHTMELASDASHVAIVAAYRNVDATQWKLVYKVNPNWYSSHRVTLTANGLIEGKPDGDG